MKKYILIIVFAAGLLSCGNNSDAESTTEDTTTSKQTEPAEKSKDIPQVKPAFANLDGNVASHIKNIFEHYIHVKTALVNSDSAEAKNGANAIVQVLKDFDKSLLPADQKAAYDKSIPAIRTSAKNIASSENLEKQREHFASLSTQSYDLAKAFGPGKTLYHEHCPMAMNDKGAMWLSESKEIKNPYYGDKMLDCGTVEEIIEN